MSFRVECSPGFCGPDCTTTNVTNPRVVECQAGGTLTCDDNRLDPSPPVACNDCLYNLDITTECSTCLNTNYDPVTNCIQCLPGWDITSDCTSCLPNRDPVTNCTQCLPNRDPSTNCSLCLQPKRFTDTDCSVCALPGGDPATFCQTCLSLGRDPNTNCTCKDNYDESTDCSTCVTGWDSNYDCSVCLTGRNISTDCTTCIPGYSGEDCRLGAYCKSASNISNNVSYLKKRLPWSQFEHDMEW